MDISKEELNKVINLDVVAGFSKFMAIIYIFLVIINIVFQPEIWYLIIPIQIGFIFIYKLRANFIRKKFKSYKVINAKIIKLNIISFIQGTRKLTYSYKYEGKEYTGSSTILDFLRESSSVKKGNLIRIIINLDNPEMSKILSLY